MKNMLISIRSRRVLTLLTLCGVLLSSSLAKAQS
jgi:hypothetical protein